MATCTRLSGNLAVLVISSAKTCRLNRLQVPLKKLSVRLYLHFHTFAMIYKIDYCIKGQPKRKSHTRAMTDEDAAYFALDWCSTQL